MTAEDYLAAYDAQLRTEAETPSAISVTELGPLRLATFAGGRGFVTYRDLGDAGAETIAEWVEQAVAHYRADPHVRHVEWKTRGHDRAPGLHEALLVNGFGGRAGVDDDGEAGAAVDVELADGVELRCIAAEAERPRDERDAGGGLRRGLAEETTSALKMIRLARGEGMELWVAEADGAIVSSLAEPVLGTEVRGNRGRRHSAERRRRGIYRALTAERAARRCGSASGS